MLRDRLSRNLKGNVKSGSIDRTHCVVYYRSVLLLFEQHKIVCDSLIKNITMGPEMRSDGIEGLVHSPLKKSFDVILAT